jgi:hypothetical protein
MKEAGNRNRKHSDQHESEEADKFSFAGRLILTLA